ncbi:hypothetical protein ACFV2X_01440 [Streptomyces sp. NPDC059679]|uniref:hypothetical protein n=1 Tax=Streptomyces sp. NPDC059679 TaxID=3346903 RepID=UPI0036B0F1D2
MITRWVAGHDDLGRVGHAAYELYGGLRAAGGAWRVPSDSLVSQLRPLHQALTFSRCVAPHTLVIGRLWTIHLSSLRSLSAAPPPSGGGHTHPQE